VKTAFEPIYLDSSALVKLVAAEAETDALGRFLKVRPLQLSCIIARVEVLRAAYTRDAVTVAQARHLLRGLILLQLDEQTLEVAAELKPVTLRSLDAIHIAAALEAEITDLITYDRRMAAAAESLGLRVLAPGAEL